MTPEDRISAMSNPLSTIMLSSGSSFSSKPKHFVNTLPETETVERYKTKLIIPLE